MIEKHGSQGAVPVFPMYIEKKSSEKLQMVLFASNKIAQINLSIC